MEQERNTRNVKLLSKQTMASVEAISSLYAIKELAMKSWDEIDNRSWPLVRKLWINYNIIWMLLFYKPLEEEIAEMNKVLAEMNKVLRSYRKHEGIQGIRRNH